MKNKISYAFLRAIAALVMGLVLVMFPADAGIYLVITLGIVFLIPSLLSIISHYSVPEEERGFFPIVGLGSALFGLWLLVMPGFFVKVLTLALGVILLLAGGGEVYTLLVSRRWVRVPGMFYVLPMLIFLSGLVALLYPMDTQETVFMIIGITSLVYAVSELTNWFFFTRKKPNHPVKTDDVQDVEVIE
jgi:uncharacterized membrane protein HdeD (DUF308 family)